MSPSSAPNHARSALQTPPHCPQASCKLLVFAAQGTPAPMLAPVSPALQTCTRASQDHQSAWRAPMTSADPMQQRHFARARRATSQTPLLGSLSTVRAACGVRAGHTSWGATTTRARLAKRKNGLPRTAIGKTLRLPTASAPSFATRATSSSQRPPCGSTSALRARPCRRRTRALQGSTGTALARRARDLLACRVQTWLGAEFTACQTTTGCKIAPRPPPRRTQQISRPFPLYPVRARMPRPRKETCCLASLTAPTCRRS